MGCKVFWTKLSRSMNCIRIYPRKGLFWLSMKLFCTKSKIWESIVLITSFHHVVFKPAFISHFKFQFRILTLPILWHRITFCSNFFQTWWETQIKEAWCQTLEWTWPIYSINKTKIKTMGSIKWWQIQIRTCQTCVTLTNHLKFHQMVCRHIQVVLRWIQHNLSRICQDLLTWEIREMLQ